MKRAAILTIQLLLFAIAIGACSAAVPNEGDGEARNALKSWLQSEGIVQTWDLEIVPQSPSGHDDTTNLVFAISNPADLGREGCTADADVFAVAKQEQIWVTKSRQHSKKLALSPCSDVAPQQMVDIDGDVSARDLERTVSALVKILHGTDIIDADINFEPPSLKQVLAGASQSSLFSVQRRGEHYLEYEFAIKGCLPYLLNVKFDLSSGNRLEAYVSLKDQLEIIRKDRDNQDSPKCDGLAAE